VKPCGGSRFAIEGNGKGCLKAHPTGTDINHRHRHPAGRLEQDGTPGIGYNPKTVAAVTVQNMLQIHIHRELYSPVKDWLNGRWDHRFSG
jgi:hypothetical protein